MKAYAVIAYRWGWLNNSSYIVDITTDLEAAQNAAVAETHSRGGKYGVTVWDCKSKAVFHAPSSYGEAQAHNNYRLGMFQKVGLDVAVALEDGTPLTGEQILASYRSAKHEEQMLISFDGTNK